MPDLSAVSLRIIHSFFLVSSSSISSMKLVVCYHKLSTSFLIIHISFSQFIALNIYFCAAMHSIHDITINNLHLVVNFSWKDFFSSQFNHSMLLKVHRCVPTAGFPFIKNSNATFFRATHLFSQQISTKK